MKAPRQRLWKNKDLIDFYELYNKLYFGNKLPPLVCLKFMNMKHVLGRTSRFRLDKHHRSQKDTFGIFIDKSQRHSRRLWAMTMVHEMVHVEDRCRHSCSLRGRYFNRRMLELAVAGAFDGLW